MSELNHALAQYALSVSSCNVPRKQAAQGVDFVEPDVQFRIAQAGYNLVLYRMMESVNELFKESRRITSMEPGMTARGSLPFADAEALCDRTAPQARLLMLAHMNDVLSSLMALQSKEPLDEV